MVMPRAKSFSIRRSLAIREILTDPSYCQQIITLTYPHIGNVGTNRGDAEAARIHASGLVVRDCPRVASNWRSQRPLDQYLRECGVIAIADIDIRRLTRCCGKEVPRMVSSWRVKVWIPIGLEAGPCISRAEGHGFGAGG